MISTLSNPESSAVHEAFTDEAFMDQALALGRTNLGLVAPNPSVGALIVKAGVVVGSGVTAPGGRPHAETVALAAAGVAARGATVYVTLEPCSHFGHTGPCADALIAAGVLRIVSAFEDPDPRVSGLGHARLRAAGVQVRVGVRGPQALHDNLGHVLRVTQSRPMVTLKLSETRDGYAAGNMHDHRLMITGQEANIRTHQERARHDAIMLGVGTILTDDPLMNVRLPDLEQHQPIRIVLDSHLRTPLSSRLVALAAGHPTWIITGKAASVSRAEALEGKGIRVLRVATNSRGQVDLPQALSVLAKQGVTRVFSEGGPTVGSALIEAGLADRCMVFTAAKPLGRSGVDALDAAARSKLSMPGFYALTTDELCGQDRLRIYDRSA